MATTETTAQANTEIFTSERREVRDAKITAATAGYLHGEIVNMGTDGIYKKCVLSTDDMYGIVYGGVAPHGTMATIILSGAVDSTKLHGVTTTNAGAVRKKLAGQNIYVENI